MPKSRHATRAMISAVMAELGKRGGKAGTGDTKRRGGETKAERSEYYRKLVAKRRDRAKKSSPSGES